MVSSSNLIYSACKISMTCPRFPQIPLSDLLSIFARCKTRDICEKWIKSKTKRGAYLRHFVCEEWYLLDFFQRDVIWHPVDLVFSCCSHHFPDRSGHGTVGSPVAMQVPVPSSHPSCGGEVFERVEACGGRQAGLSPQLTGLV